MLNTSTNTLTTNVTVGPDPVQVAVTPNGAAAYVPNPIRRAAVYARSEVEAIKRAQPVAIGRS